LAIGLSNVRKYAIVADPNESQITIIDIQEKLMPGMYDALGASEENDTP
jgi:hypothetical protein